MEVPKRLAPTKVVLRDLYLKSGNQCAFPSCKRTILNDKGHLVGQVCHIEAAMPGGERFNSKQTNEERRAFSNLMLLCYDHHIETNDVKKYTVKRLKKMKLDHEKKYSDATEKLLSSTVSDMTLLQEYEYCSSLKKINKILDWGNSKKELLETIPLFNRLIDILRKLSPDTRAIFSIMVARSERSEINLQEISEVTGKPQADLVNHVLILVKYELIFEPESNDYGIPVTYFKQYDLWDMWDTIKEYSELTSITLDELITNMRFSLLD
ncbi:hypothetical protein [Cytobacillus praedii]|uniref:hypothetical protein n=1 Tax=Cytobacillus praedii TaxID=1742358 RepID=UPI002E1B684C|nr:hypothetical protein [Cytobacillus praedii]